MKRSKDKIGVEGYGVEVPREKTLECEGTDVPANSFATVVGQKEKGEANVISDGKSGVCGAEGI